MYYIYDADFKQLENATQYADAFYKAQLIAELRNESVMVYYNTNFKIKVNPN